MMEKVYSRPSGIFEGAVTGFCPGCMHSSVCKIVTEALDELGMVDNACYVQGVGCCGLAVTYFDFDTVAAPHGRACAIASSFKPVSYTHLDVYKRQPSRRTRRGRRPRGRRTLPLS